eukprot:1988416-Amphidinium_carterae.3
MRRTLPKLSEAPLRRASQAGRILHGHRSIPWVQEKAGPPVMRSRCECAKREQILQGHRSKPSVLNAKSRL